MTRPPEGHGYIDFVGVEEHYWRIETIWQAARALPARETALDDIPWRRDGCFVLGHPPTWGALAEHCRRALDADLGHPVVLGPEGEVVDGMHRIIRAWLEGRTAIEAVRLESMPPPDRVRPLESKPEAGKGEEEVPAQ